ncbi:MAG: hypothetical protein MUF49_31355 [Oculatellaceae cyanobacterium Prado106]|jgi:hypothetical protein|nr:hypothetical protein [Oculatellaceae cyanobacterium Prado106]
MTHPFFCSEVSKQAREDLIGSATPYQTFILIECPFPWTAEAFDSPWVPPALKELVAFVKAARLPIRFLLVNQSLNKGKSDVASPKRIAHPTQVLIYQRSPHRFCPGYQRYEWRVHHPNEIVPLVQSYLRGQLPGDRIHKRPVRDLLVCVHGSHDKCCARYGLPFCREAIATLNTLPDLPIRLWQTSHFGGHRFAPTLIDFPTGRYYGRMDQAALKAILTRSGAVQLLDSVYRGWSILPTPLQVAEAALMQQYGWSWFDYRIAYQILRQRGNSPCIQAKLWAMQPDYNIHTYAVEVIKDSSKTICLRTSCGATQESEQTHYGIKSLLHLDTKPAFATIQPTEVSS